MLEDVCVAELLEVLVDEVVAVVVVDVLLDDVDVVLVAVDDVDVVLVMVELVDAVQVVVVVLVLANYSQKLSQEFVGSYDADDGGCNWLQVNPSLSTNLPVTDWRFSLFTAQPPPRIQDPDLSCSSNIFSRRLSTAHTSKSRHAAFPTGHVWSPDTDTAQP